MNCIMQGFSQSLGGPNHSAPADLRAHCAATAWHEGAAVAHRDAGRGLAVVDKTVVVVVAGDVVAEIRRADALAIGAEVLLRIGVDAPALRRAAAVRRDHPLVAEVHRDHALNRDTGRPPVVADSGLGIADPVAALSVLAARHAVVAAGAAAAAGRNQGVRGVAGEVAAAPRAAPPFWPLCLPQRRPWRRQWFRRAAWLSTVPPAVIAATAAAKARRVPVRARDKIEPDSVQRCLRWHEQARASAGRLGSYQTAFRPRSSSDSCRVSHFLGFSRPLLRPRRKRPIATGGPDDRDGARGADQSV
jgi:hypothetical protein